MATNHLSKSRLNKLRAAVLGANDGIISTASVVMGVAGADLGQTSLVAAGLAALVAGALSMAVGEYVSVSSQSDAEKVHIERAHNGDASKHEITNPMQAAVASLLAFTAGGLVPFLTIIVSPHNIAAITTAVGVIFALSITGYVSATFGGASRRRATIRVVSGGILAMLITYLVGTLFGTAIS